MTASEPSTPVQPAKRMLMRLRISTAAIPGTTSCQTRPDSVARTRLSSLVRFRTHSHFRSFALALAVASVFALACDRASEKQLASMVVIGDGGPEAERGAAIEFAEGFLERLDAGLPIAELLVPAMKVGRPDTEVESTFSGLRHWTGSLTSRKGLSYGYAETLETGESGRYFTVYFVSRFENGQVDEKVVVALDDSDHRVAGYSQKRHGSPKGDPGAAPNPTTAPPPH